MTVDQFSTSPRCSLTAFESENRSLSNAFPLLRSAVASCSPDEQVAISTRRASVTSKGLKAVLSRPASTRVSPLLQMRCLLPDRMAQERPDTPDRHSSSLQPFAE